MQSLEPNLLYSGQENVPFPFHSNIYFGDVGMHVRIC